MGTHIDTIVVGGSQSGLTMGYHLKRRGIPFLILEANESVGDAWRNRWDSLRLFTPAKFSGLVGMRFPARANHKPTKDEMADYLDAYARHFELPVRTGVRVKGIGRSGKGFVVDTGTERVTADNVVVATGAYQVPRVPQFAGDLEPGILQLHSSEYRGPSQLRPGGVLVVGVGNSGGDISLEVARTHPTWLAGKEFGHIPFRVDSVKARFLVYGVRFVGHHVLSLRTPIGRKVAPKLIGRAAPLVRVKPKDILAAGIERVPRVAGVRDGKPLLDDGRTLDVANVIWCTGFRPDYTWIDVSVCDERGYPKHQRGCADDVAGLYYMGLKFQFSLTSDTIVGIGRDAAHIAKDIANRAARGRASAATRLPSAASMR